MTIDYVHVNSIFPDTGTSIIISSRYLNEITLINKETGLIIWRMGGKNNQFQMMNDTRQFAGQHSVLVEKNGNVTLFDNGLDLVPEYSRGIEYQVDVSDKKVWLVNEYLHNPLKYGNIMGSMQKLENGNGLIYWGGMNLTETSAFSEYNTDKELVMEAEFINKTLPSYRVYKQLWEPDFLSFDKDTLVYVDIETGYESGQNLIIKNISRVNRSIDSVFCTSANFYVKENLPFTLFTDQEKAIQVYYGPKSIEKNTNSFVFYSKTDSVFFSKKVIVRPNTYEPTGMKDKYKNELKIWPNPFQDRLIVKSDKFITQIQIFDLLGKHCFSNKNHANEFHFDLDILKKGNYLLLIRYFDNSIENKIVSKL